MKNKGITLIALIVTIIVMLILVAITLQITLGKNGIIVKTKEAKEQTEIASKQEEVNFVIAELVAKNGGDATLITPHMISDRLNEISDRGITAEPGNYFPTEIVYPATVTSINKEIRIEVNPLFAEIVIPELYDYEIIDETEKTVRISGIQKDYRKRIDIDVDDIIYEEETLTALTLPSKVEINGARYTVVEIGDHAFAWIRFLDTVIIPDSVKKIGDSAFHQCYNLIDITIPDSVTEIGESPFSDTNLINITVDENNNNYSSENGILFNKSKTTIVWYPGYKTATQYSIPDSVTKIGKDAFYRCQNLTNITIPDSVTEIGEDAFESCSSLASITIPDSVTEIGSGTFCGCTSLASITIPDSVKKIGEYAFYQCYNLIDITIPDSVIEIGSGAFSACKNLANIYLSGDEIEGSPWGAPSETVITWNYTGE